MDLQAALSKFFNEKGEITLAPQLTLAGLAEMMYQADIAQGGAERPALRAWDFSADPAGVATDFSRQEVNTRIKAVAARLQQVSEPGARAAILAGNSPHYLFAFLGALYAGVIPVPLYDPKEPGHADHLQAVFADSKPTVVLTDSLTAPAVRAYFASVPARQRPRIIAVDALPDTLAASWQPVPPVSASPVDGTAFLQYTSGSTRTPAGVELTNRSILTNVLQIFVASKMQPPMRMVSWLPLHHDMGIILGAFLLIFGLHMELLAPRDFVQQPSRWTKLIARRGAEDVATYTVVPNFALELAARFGTPEAEADFSNVEGLIIGSEPVTRSGLETFWNIFKEHGLKRDALRPSYGLAEASLLVTTPQGERPIFSNFDRDELAAGRAQVIAEDSDKGVVFASNGQPAGGIRLIVVDPDTRKELADGQVGELWMHGGNMAAGYLNRPDETAETFENEVASFLDAGSHAGANAPTENWLATGDLGVYLAGEVYITGRLKDLIVIAGRNHYPQDIEYTVVHATNQVDPVGVAAFSIAGDAVEQLVILAERAPQAPATPEADAAAIAAIRAAVNSAHAVSAADIQILNPGQIARSSSAKIARRVARKNYLAGTEANQA
ncbi:FadD32-like long-chain-fatty-acid--AMP ligase [Corynebacterium caspium]|uniref:FadD32-like long-chain-fatty-acid--AMP ligase n=1 Tax=Corynebacterium caspium TaxID=234828 RepID=UPI00036A6C36|nr:FadD32-like long-chain-fatty-acid--AMP ligase [Corynebacterium caspium]WKD59980.1 Long-chain-fatty-acid--AMP ligase FadD32 [Corynebacterium caspium DSM 44850]